MADVIQNIIQFLSESNGINIWAAQLLFDMEDQCEDCTELISILTSELIPWNIAGSNLTLEDYQMQGLVTFADELWIRQSPERAKEVLRSMDLKHPLVILLKQKSDEDNVIKLVSDDLDLGRTLRFDSMVFVSDRESLFEVYKLMKEIVAAPVHTPHKSLYIWDRRRDLKGLELRLAYTHYDSNPFDHKRCQMFDCLANHINKSGFRKHQLDIAKELSRILNFTVKWKIANGYGNQNSETGEWNGIVRLLKDEEADLSFNMIAITCKYLMNIFELVQQSESCKFLPDARAKAIQFIPIVELNILMYMLLPEQSANYKTYITVLSKEYLLICQVLMGVLAITLMTFEKGSLKQRLINGLGTSLSAMVGLSIDNQSDYRLSKRILILTVSMYGTLNWRVYNAGLTSALTAQHSEWPVTYFSEILPNGYQVLVRSGTAYYDQCRVDIETKEIFEKTIQGNPDALYRTTEEAAAKILSGGKYIVPEADSSPLAINYRGKIGAPLTMRKTLRAGLGFTYNSEYLDIFNHILTKMKENGILERIKEGSVTLQEANRPSEDIEISYNNCISIFMVLACMSAASILALGLECISWKLKQDAH